MLSQISTQLWWCPNSLCSLPGWQQQTTAHEASNVVAPMSIHIDSETFLPGHCYLKSFMHMTSVLTNSSFLLQRLVFCATALRYYFRRDLGIYHVNCIPVLYSQSYRGCLPASTTAWLLWTVCYCQNLWVHHSIMPYRYSNKAKSFHECSNTGTHCLNWSRVSASHIQY